MRVSIQSETQTPNPRTRHRLRLHVTGLVCQVSLELEDSSSLGGDDTRILTLTSVRGD